MAPIFPEQRQQMIAARLARGDRVVAAALAREFDTSEDTVRRDLRLLAAAGMCRKVYGGALPLADALAPLAVRETEAPERKAALARAACRLPAPNEVVLIDAGSTNQAIARALPTGLGLTVVTNAPGIAAALAGRTDLTLVMLGGRIDPRSGAACGPAALEQLRGLRADLCLLGACTVDVEAGVGAADLEEAAFKRAMVAVSGRVAAAVTTEKLGAAGRCAVVPLAALSHLVVEADAPAQFETCGPTLLRAESLHAE